MCKAHILRFSCSHGLLMSLEVCSGGVPCPIIKPVSGRIPQQPFRCYNCQRKRSASSTPESSRTSSCSSSLGSIDSASSFSSPSPSINPSNGQSTSKSSTAITGCPDSWSGFQPNYGISSSSCKKGKYFSFACSNLCSAAPHYTTLPSDLPHQDHVCPPCQLEHLREKSDADMFSECHATWPLVQAQRMRERRGPELVAAGSYAVYLDERRQEEKELWLYVGRKWVQDLKKARVLVNEEDGLGLLC